MLANSDIQKLYAQCSNNLGSKNAKFESGLTKERSMFLGRMKLILVIALLITIAIVSRLIYMNTVNSNFLSQQINSRIMRTIKLVAMRGTLTDRNGNPLAVSTPVASIWADPTELDNLTPDKITRLADILGMTVPDLNKKLNEKQKTFVYIKREVTPEQAHMVKALDIEGIYSLQEYKRFYPYSNVTAHVVGFTNIDDKGSEGMEYAANQELTGEDGYHQIIRDRQGHVVDNIGDQYPAVNGENIALSIDTNIQYFAYEALKKQVELFNAVGGAAVVLNAKTGEVLAMVNMPDYNPNNRAGVPIDALKNRAAIDVYEPGSIIKPLVVSKALDQGLVTPSTVFNTHNYVIGSKLFKDDHPFPSLTVAQIIQHSSDIGSIKIGTMLAPKDMWTYYHDIGFGHKLDTNFPGEASGIMQPWKSWRKLDQAEMSFGYSIAVSLMQMAHAYTLFTNNGCILPISFYKLQGYPKCTQVIRPSTAKEMDSMLMTVVDAGTGRNAQVPGYTIAGKTGTAHIATGHGYKQNAYYSSFVGYAPAVNPRIIVAVTVDNPRKGGYYAAKVAAPVFSNMAGQTLKYLKVRPDNLASLNKVATNSSK